MGNFSFGWIFGLTACLLEFNFSENPEWQGNIKYPTQWTTCFLALNWKSNQAEYPGIATLEQGSALPHTFKFLEVPHDIPFALNLHVLWARAGVVFTVGHDPGCPWRGN